MEGKREQTRHKYIHGKEWDAKFLEVLVSEKMKPLIMKISHLCKQGDSSSELLIGVKTWMKTN